jgi:hypothetical protein
MMIADVRSSAALIGWSNQRPHRDFLTMYQTMRLLGVSRQTVWQRVKRGEIKALHVRCGRKKGLRLKVIRSQSDLFDRTSQAGV